jgi:hypothetical protein
MSTVAADDDGELLCPGGDEHEEVQVLWLLRLGRRRAPGGPDQLGHRRASSIRVHLLGSSEDMTWRRTMHGGGQDMEDMEEDKTWRRTMQGKLHISPRMMASRYPWTRKVTSNL